MTITTREMIFFIKMHKITERLLPRSNIFTFFLLTSTIPELNHWIGFRFETEQLMLQIRSLFDADKNTK